jgi:UDP-N-acetylmuramate dehydrogenase
MQKPKRNFNLQKINTFGIKGRAAWYVEAPSIESLRHHLLTAQQPHFILGGGSNILLRNDWPGTVIRITIGGIGIERQSESEVVVGAGAGVRWHDLVLWTLEHDFGGQENLSLIPGTVGAAPIQNIGAYGVELKDVFEKLEAMNRSTGEIRVFAKAECHFGYRDSTFKNDLRDRYVIMRVYFRLTKLSHRLNTGYGDIQRMLESRGLAQPGIRDVSDAVIAIRRSKLPDPAQLGNAGSFFKNPEIGLAQFQDLISRFPEMVHYPQPGGTVKVPAGWLIEQCGWKGHRRGNAGCHEKQALVLVNFGNATGEEIWQLAIAIQSSVREKFGILLQPEVNVVG